MCMDDMHCIYLVGGNERSILKFDLETNRWEKLHIFLKEARNHPNVFIVNKNIYVAFGEFSKKLVPTIEKGKITGKGELKIIGKDDKNKRICSGIIVRPNNAFLVGGMDEKFKPLDTCVNMDLRTGKTMASSNKIDEPAFFGQGLLAEIGDDEFGNFSLTENNVFLTMNFGSK